MLGGSFGLPHAASANVPVEPTQSPAKNTFERSSSVTSGRDDRPPSSARKTMGNGQFRKKSSSNDVCLPARLDDIKYVLKLGFDLCGWFVNVVAHRASGVQPPLRLGQAARRQNARKNKSDDPGPRQSDHPGAVASQRQVETRRPYLALTGKPSSPRPSLGTLSSEHATSGGTARITACVGSTSPPAKSHFHARRVTLNGSCAAPVIIAAPWPPRMARSPSMRVCQPPSRYKTLPASAPWSRSIAAPANRRS